MIRKNVIYGILGFIIPALSIIFSIPILISGIGRDSFGIFTIGSSLSGSLAFLDFGFSSAATKYVSEYMSNNRYDDVGSIVKTSLAFYGLLSLMIMSLIWIIAPYLPNFFSVPHELNNESIKVFRIGSIQFCFIMLTGVYISLFKSLYRFDISLFITSYISVVSYAVSAIFVWMKWVDLVGVVLIGLFASISGLIIAKYFSILILRKYNIILNESKASFVVMKKMIGFGSILTIHSIAGIFFNQIQRLIIGNQLGTSAVAIYQVAYSAVSKSHSLISAATEVVFPITSGLRDHVKINRLYIRSLAISSIFSIAILFPIWMFSYKILFLWVGKDIAISAAPIMRVLSVAFFFVAISSTPYYIMNGIGRPIINVIYSISNVILYISVLAYFFINMKIDLYNISLSFTISNVITGSIFQTASMIIIKKYRRNYFDKEINKE